jgi:hypothetical protein
MATFDGKRVSRSWFRVLTAARADGVRFTLNSGKRTMREQTALFRQNMQLVGGRWIQRPGRPLTAFPSPTAPHIRVGLANHALDVNALDGGENRLQAWLAKHGVHAVNNVAGEAWHLDAPLRELLRFARRLRAKARRQRRRERRRRRARRAERRMLERARKHGARHVRVIRSAAKKHGIPFPLALALVEQESGFINQYGHDRDSAGRIVWHGRTGRFRVTPENVRDYLAWRRRNGVAQGVGLTQLTSPEYQDRAARMPGGLSDVGNQLDVGFDVLASHIKALGTRKGIGAYNGGRGNPQLDYADQVLALRDRWARRLKIKESR